MTNGRNKQGGSRLAQRRVSLRLALGLAFLTGLTSAHLAHAYSGSRLPRLTAFDVSLYGLAATVDPLEPTVPKNTASAIRILVTAGDHTLTTAELAEALGGPFEVHAEVSGP